MRSLYTYLEHNPGGRAEQFHELSHGEGFLEILRTRVSQPGFHLMDKRQCRGAESPIPPCKFQMLTGHLNRDITPGPGGPSTLKPIQAQPACGSLEVARRVLPQMLTADAVAARRCLSLLVAVAVS